MRSIADHLAESGSRYSPCGLAFLQAVAGESRLLRRSTFRALDEPHEFVQYPLQSWPLFLAAESASDFGAVAATLARLVRSLPERFFRNDAGALAEFYGLEDRNALFLETLLEDAATARGLLCRGDFIETPGGLQCLELNATSNLGGWKSASWVDRYRQVPELIEFVRRQPWRIVFRDTVVFLYRHLLVECRDFATGGELNVAFVVPPNNRGPGGWETYASEALRGILRSESITGAAFICDYPDLVESGQEVFLRGRRIHVIVETYEGYVAPHVFRCWMAGNVQVYNGPVGHLLCDKRNLAVLSEYQDADDFDAGERAFIAAHVPWTRCATAGYTHYEGRRIFVPDLLIEQRQRMVLKPARGGRGVDVHVGRFMAPDLWEHVVYRALEEGGWVIQERVEGVPRLFQTGEEGYGPHDLVWGLFSFGDTYAGGFLRMVPSGRQGVVNAAQGASESVVLEARPQHEELEPGLAEF